MTIAFKTATELAHMIREKKISSRELLDLYLARIEKYNPALNAVVTLEKEGARTIAHAADLALKNGNGDGALHGVPMTIKDTFEISGLRTTAGAKIFSKHVPKNTAIAAQRLMDAGAQVAPEPARSLGAIVSGVDGDVHNAAICKSALALACCFGSKVIAGDVQAESQLAWPQAHRCAEA